MLDDLRIRKFSKDEARMLNSLQLALVGDGVFEVFIRNYILTQNTALSANKIHVKAIGYVKAKSQACIMHEIENLLNEEEEAVYKRGRNAKSPTVPKNAEIRDYRMATGFEALIGYLYLVGDKERLEFIFNRSIEIIN
ncbi:Mini-ribonuclease 3 [Clostridium beijerinckii]|uniref:Mini-ribonuclease 3 n=1 Tax=Clostridium beijerinckii TaxID=1520 RepID=UPI00098CEA24|nr:ribonuclease III domain-containing protein [Clostridium beijerinckii]MBA8936125.1 ribonuclease-3 family protein [Clostridium beijerinckii]NRT32350.1 ribonuclease-3 family protein [Clostridium beijerinckii]NRT48222.1 ribonuclease-3 family protein [Clostridium beijerinckii]NRU36198.1 ribonuclease-3 family protein [Clostridium beijerinckii]NRZ23481.1 ribonuclease-3 family protein [Clostridium beijerinckii]